MLSQIQLAYCTAVDDRGFILHIHAIVQTNASVPSRGSSIYCTDLAVCGMVLLYERPTVNRKLNSTPHTDTLPKVQRGTTASASSMTNTENCEVPISWLVCLSHTRARRKITRGEIGARSLHNGSTAARTNLHGEADHFRVEQQATSQA